MLGCVVFVVGGMFLGYKGDPEGYLSAAFFGLGLLIFGLQLYPGATYLLLEENGFTCCTLFRARSFRWEQVQGFGVIRIGRFHGVGWNFTPDYQTSHRRRELSAKSKALSSYEAHLQNDYGMGPEELAGMLNGILHEWTVGRRASRLPEGSEEMADLPTTPHRTITEPGVPGVKSGRTRLL